MEPASDTKSSPSDPPSSATAGAPILARIGQYEIRRVIGSGGMGTVYEALQRNPRRSVALKVLRHGIASPSAMRRFEYEAQILARLRHPGIAQVYEAGTYLDGAATVPYFVMEYVPGAKPLTDYASSMGLNPRQRLELLVQVCEAVHHGHQRGVIHRDLKPENLLVDANGLVKVIDFGLARATDADIAMTTMQTHAGQLLGTLPYMPPEQVEADPLDVDLRSDVYAIGVVAYELLSSRLPHDLRGLGLSEALLRIRTGVVEKLGSHASHLRGDVETIIAKALERDRNRRYGSALDLGRDLQRFLNGEAISARPPSVAYQLKAFARRHRYLVTAVATVAVILVAATIASTTAYVRAEKARAEAAEERAAALEARAEAESAREAEHVQRLAAEASRVEALRQGRIAEAVNEFLDVDVLGAGDPMANPDRELTVRAALDAASWTIDGRLPDEPLVEASLRTTLGRTYLNLARYDEAEAQIGSALKILELVQGKDDPSTIEARALRGELAYRRGDYAAAERDLRATLEAQQRIAGENDIQAIGIMGSLAFVLQQQARYGEAEELYQRALEGLPATEPRRAEMLVMLHANIGLMYAEIGRTAEAEEMLLQAVEEHLVVHGEEHPLTLTCMGNLASVYNQVKRFDEARTWLERTLEVQTRVLGEDHPSTAITLNNLAFLHWQTGALDEAEFIFRSLLELRRETLGPTHPHALLALSNLGNLLGERGRVDVALPMLEEALELHRETLGEGHPDTLRSANDLARLLISQGRLEDARALLGVAVGHARERPDLSHVVVGVLLEHYGQCLLRLAEVDEAERVLLEAHAWSLEHLGAAHAQTRSSAHCLAALYEARGDAAAAESWHRRASE